MKQILFFALKSDLLQVFKDFETAGAVKYVATDTINSPHYAIWTQGAALPNLGKASQASAINCDSYLVCGPDTEINLRALSPIDSKERFAIDQLKNPDTIVFSPAGEWNEDILLHGRVSTTSTSQLSQSLMRRFQKALRKSFVKIKAFYVGPQALVLLKNGRRLTISVQSPIEFDLTLK